MNEPKLDRCQTLAARALESAESRLAAARYHLGHSTGGNATMAKKERQVEVCQYIVEVLQRAPLPDNKALTVEELREMDGEWVWVVAEDEPEPVPMKIDTTRRVAITMHVDNCPFNYYGLGTEGYYGWLSYRRTAEDDKAREEGRWSVVYYGIGICEVRYQCSCCKQYENVRVKSRYCPNCGAKMYSQEAEAALSEGGKG